MTAISETSLKRIALAGARVRRQSGFTLLELMVVVLVLGVLAGLAYASYENATIASRRKAAAACPNAATRLAPSTPAAAEKSGKSGTEESGH